MRGERTEMVYADIVSIALDGDSVSLASVGRSDRDDHYKNGVVAPGFLAGLFR